MNLEELPPQVEETPVETPVPETPQAFAWELPDPKPPTQEPLSQDAVRQMIREDYERLRSEEREPDFEEALIGKALQVFEQRAAVREAPRARRDLVDDLTQGLGASAKEYLSDYLDGYDASVIGGIRSDKKTMGMLRLAAEQAEAKKPASKSAPRSESAATVSSEHADSQVEGELMTLWKGGFKTAFEEHGKTFDDFRKEMTKRIK